MRKILIAIAILHVIGWGLLIGLGAEALALSTGILAYTLGIRHAFDADHLVAIDATTRQLIHEHKDSHGVGFFFSLGHSTIVFAATVLSLAGIGTIAQDLLDENSLLKQSGSFIGTLTAASFLTLLAIYNFYILLKILRKDDAQPSGFFSRFIRPARSPKHMYPIGMLFGLGFDTATSVAILSLSIISVTSGQLMIAAIALPIIFTSGMALGDTLSGYIMQRSMKWAIASEKRRIYNLILTITAITASLLIGIPLFFDL